MAWKETNVIEERLKFIAAYKAGGWTMSDLCREFSISRKTGYKYLQRYEAEGIEALKDRSRAPKTQRRATRAKLVELVKEEREKHPSWGARKVLASLQTRHPRIKNWPSSSTVGRILKREGLIADQERRRRSYPVKSYPLSHVLEANDVWCVDFKGWFMVGDGVRCDPLTVTDAYSRFLLACRIVARTNTEHVQLAFTDLFREFGLPEAMRSDNGSPFAARALAGLSRLSVWWLKLGIRLERIEPGKPYQNGRHERMHLTLKRETTLPPRSTIEAQQAAFDRFRQEYNYERPHEALKNRRPADLYRKSRRVFPEKLEAPAYPTGYEVERVTEEGVIRYGMHRVFIASALAGEVIGLEEISERHRRIYFASSAIGVLDVFTGKVLQYANPTASVES